MDGYLSKPVRQELLKGEIKRVSGSDGAATASPPSVALAEKPRQAVWDLKELLKRLGGDQDFLRELLLIFRQDVQVSLTRAETCIAMHDLAELSRAAHTMKGMLRNLSMTTAAESAGALENAAREKKSPESEELLGRLSKELEEILPEVEHQLAEVKT